MKNSGKTLTIFIVVIAILLVSLTVISVFFFLKEVELRSLAETNLEQMNVVEAKLQEDLKVAKKQVFLLEEKNNEGVERLESLLEELELEKGLREEIKKDYRELKEVFEKDSKEKERMQAELTSFEEKNALLQRELTTTVEQRKEMEMKVKELQSVLDGVGSGSSMIDKPMTESVPIETRAELADPNVQLEPIVINSGGTNGGKVISVDDETHFVIVSLGSKAGIDKGDLLSISRDGNYLGDVKVTRVLPEMSAADFVPPLSTSKIKKNDQVVIKE